MVKLVKMVKLVMGPERWDLWRNLLNISLKLAVEEIEMEKHP